MRPGSSYPGDYIQVINFNSIILCCVALFDLFCFYIPLGWLIDDIQKIVWAILSWEYRGQLTKLCLIGIECRGRHSFCRGTNVTHWMCSRLLVCSRRFRSSGVSLFSWYASLILWHHRFMCTWITCVPCDFST